MSGSSSSSKKRNYHEESAWECPLKRIRGGVGGEDDDDDNNNEFAHAADAYEAELIDMEMMQEEPDFVPDDVDPLLDDNDDNTDSANNMSHFRDKWSRPRLESKFTNHQDLNVQWLDIDMVAGPPLKQHPNVNKNKIPGNTSGQQVPVIRVYGINEAGHSVTIFIHGFTPYAYFALPQQFSSKLFTDKLKSKIRQQLDDRLRTEGRRAQLTHFVLGVEYIQDHRSIMGYETPHTQFLKVHVAMPTLVPTLKRIMETGIDLGIPGYTGEVPLPPFECNIPFVLRYMIDQDITGAGWLSLLQQTYTVRSKSAKQTHCQVNFGTRCQHVFCFLYPRLLVPAQLNESLSLSYLPIFSRFLLSNSIYID